MNVSDTTVLKVGDNVTVWASRDVANRALLLGFGVPFLILVGVLVLTLQISHNEGLSALSGIFALLPYYAVLYLCRGKIQKSMSFYLETFNNN